MYIRHAILTAMIGFGCASQPDPDPSSNPDVTPTTTADAPTPPTPDAPTPPTPEPDERPAQGQSFYDIDVTLTDQDGQALAIDAWRGHPTLVSMIYTSCETACPATFSDLHRIESQLDEAQIADLRVMLVTLDPDRDTPEALKKAAQKYGIDESRWRLAHADHSDVHLISQTLGVEYHPTPSGEISHTALFTLLDRQGANDSRISGLGQDLTPLAKRIGEMVSSTDNDDAG